MFHRLLEAETLQEGAQEDEDFAPGQVLSGTRSFPHSEWG